MEAIKDWLLSMRETLNTDARPYVTVIAATPLMIVLFILAAHPGA